MNILKSSDLYIMFPCIISQKGIFKNVNTNESPHPYIESIEKQASQECSSDIFAQMQRTFLGSFQFLCIKDTYAHTADGTILRDNYTGIETDGIILNPAEHTKQKADIFLTKHHNTGLSLLIISVPQCNYNVSLIQDQITTGNLFLSNTPTEFKKLALFVLEQFSLEILGAPKTLVCVKKLPENPQELKAILAGEVFCVETPEFQICSKEISSLSQNNISQYNFYKLLASSSTLLYAFEHFSDVYMKNIEYETIMVFICELILLQHSAVIRTNNRITQELTKNSRIHLKDIENLYIEFGKTVVFRDLSCFKYILPQNLFDAISKAFKTPELLEKYQRNQAHLEHIVALRNSQSVETEGKVINAIAVLLGILQFVPIILDPSKLVPVLVTTSSFLSALIVIVLARKVTSRRLRDKV